VLPDARSVLVALVGERSVSLVMRGSPDPAGRHRSRPPATLDGGVGTDIVVELLPTAIYSGLGGSHGGRRFSDTYTTGWVVLAEGSQTGTVAVRGTTEAKTEAPRLDLRKRKPPRTRSRRPTRVQDGLLESAPDPVGDGPVQPTRAEGGPLESAPDSADIGCARCPKKPAVQAEPVELPGVGLVQSTRVEPSGVRDLQVLADGLNG
jgi:hypothetical protein